MKIKLFLGASILLLSGQVSATTINIDFQEPNVSYKKIPPAIFGAASGQAGVWNEVDGGVLDSNLVDINGASTGVGILVTVNQGGGFFGLPPSAANDLMEGTKE